MVTFITRGGEFPDPLGAKKWQALREGHKRPDIVIGLNEKEHRGELEAFARLTGGKWYHEWPKAGLAQGQGQTFPAAFSEAVRKSGKILVKLDGITDVAAAVRSGSRGYDKVSDNMTNFELLMLSVKGWAGEKDEAGVSIRDKVVFYRDGKVVDAPDGFFDMWKPPGTR
jgi:hypothetical protein